jgi:hypothetical protein
MRRYSRITGTGSSLPPRRVTNADLVAELAQRGIETSDEWIVERTGIRPGTLLTPRWVAATWVWKPPATPWRPLVCSRKTLT